MKKELERRLRLLDRLKEKVDIIFLDSLHAEDFSFTYFTNADIPGIFLYDFKEARFYAPKMEVMRARKSFLKPEIIENEFIKELGRNLKHKRVGINAKCLPFKVARRFKCIDISNYLEEAMSIKSEYEIKMIKKACKLTEKVLKNSVGKIEECKNEKELRLLIERNIYSLNCELAFEPIVAAKKNTKEPHHKASNTTLSKPILIDFGVKYRFYGSDVTRTYGSRYEKQLKNTLEALEDNIKPGTSAKRLHELAEKLLGKYAKYFITALGHGVGLYHGKPIISKYSKDVIKVNQVFTLEPGIYTSKEGARIENVYLLTQDGLVNLTDF